MFVVGLAESGGEVAGVYHQRSREDRGLYPPQSRMYSRARALTKGATHREVKTEVKEHRAVDAFERPLEPDEPKNDHQSDEDLSH